MIAKQFISYQKVNRLFYYQMMTYDIWNGLIQGIKENEEQVRNNLKKKQLTCVDEEEEEEKQKQFLESDYKKMLEIENEFNINEQESDSDDEQEKKLSKKTDIQRKNVEKQIQPSKILNQISQKINEQTFKKNKLDEQTEQTNQFEITPQIKKKPSQQQGFISNKQKQEVPQLEANKSLGSSQVKIVRRSSLVRDSKISQNNSFISNTGDSTSISSISSKRQGSADVRMSNNKIARDLEKSSQVLQKKKEQLDQQMQTKNGNNIFTLKNDAINDPLLRTSNSFFKKNFFDRLSQNANSTTMVQNNSKLNTVQQPSKQSNQPMNANATLQGNFRPQTNMQQRRQQGSMVFDSNSLQWLKIPQSIIDNMDSLFDIKKSYAQNMKSFEEFNLMMDSWIYETKKLEKALDAQSITTETLLQEVSLWPDITRIIDLFKLECENEQVQKVEKIIVEKCFTDEGLKKKIAQFKLSKRNFAQEFQQECTEYFKKLMKATFSEFPDIWVPCLTVIIQLYEKYTVVFDLRIFFVMDKIYNLLLNKMKQCSLNSQQVADTDNPEFVDNLVNTFSQFADQLIEGWKKITELSSKKESTTKIHEKMFQKKLIYLKTVMNDLMKLKETFRKLERQRKIISQSSKKRAGEEQRKFAEVANQIEKMQGIYSKQQSEIDIFDYQNKQQWDEQMKLFRQRLDVIKNAIKQLKEDSHQKENIYSQEQSKDTITTSFKKGGLEKNHKDEDFTNNKSHFGYNDNEDTEESGDNQEDDMNKTGFSFHNPMYQTQVSWKID